MVEPEEVDLRLDPARAAEAVGERAVERPERRVARPLGMVHVVAEAGGVREIGCPVSLLLPS